VITILANYERISLFHTMTPFFFPRFRHLFRIVQDADRCLRQDRNQVLFMERWFKTDAAPDLELMRRLRDKYRTICFFDGYAAAGLHGTEVLPYVDRLYHKSVFTDPSVYTRPLHAGRLFADFYHTKYGIEDSEYQYTPLPLAGQAEAERIELSWNIGLGTYPRRHLPQRIGLIAAKAGLPAVGRLFGDGRIAVPADFSRNGRSIPVHARFGMISSQTVSHQRRILKDAFKGDARFVTGVVPQNRYYAELADSKIVLSPFGWGEVCFRDFEAISAGALLMKPDMAHLVTWPDVYVPYETYVPVAWDGSDLVEKAERYLANDAERQRLARNAWERYTAQHAGAADRLAAILEGITNP